MTTKVTILNHGPDAVKVEIQGRDGSGRFTPSSEEILPAPSVKDFYVHSGQSLQVIEVKPTADEQATAQV